jgi:alpha-glucosidase (family GH31 glycosyl hydrolase)
VFEEAFVRGFLLKDPKGHPAITSWWHGEAGAIDFTEPEAVNWWKGRLERLRREIGVDSFKFDAGEIDRMPYLFSLNSSSAPAEFDPNFYTKAYVQSVSSFGAMVEVRCGRGNQVNCDK